MILEMNPDVVYVPINFSLRFCKLQFSKSYTTPDEVYVPINFSLQFCKLQFTKSYTTPDI